MTVVYAREDLPICAKDKPSIFLAGCTPRTTDVKSWRPDALNLLAELEFDGVVFVPEDRLGGFDVTIPNVWLKQVQWEIKCLDAANIVMFWIPRHVETKQYGFTSNVEFGRYVQKSILGFPENADHMRYLAWLYKEVTHRTAKSTLKDTVWAAVESVGGAFLWKNFLTP